MNLLITGAASGIGKAAAEHFTNHGHKVYGIDISAAETAAVRRYQTPFTLEHLCLR